MSPPRFFLAHAKACDDAAIEKLVQVASVLLNERAKGRPFDLVTGRAYFEARFKACGSWEAWAEEVGAGVDPITREPLFRAILVPALGAGIGAGTAKIVEYALQARKAVQAFEVQEVMSETGPHVRSAKVVAVQLMEPGNWQEGHKLTCERALL